MKNHQASLKNSIVLIFLTGTLAGCASSKMSYFPKPVAERSSHPVKKIAILPASGILATAIGAELSRLDYTVIDSASTAKLLVYSNEDKAAIDTPKSLERLNANQIDAYLTARSLVDHDGQIESAEVKVFSTHTGRIITGISWQNGWGGRNGSIADRIMRKRTTEAGQEIARSLSKIMPLE